MRRETYPRVYSQNEIYDIGTEILLLTKNDHNSTQKAPKSIIPEYFKSAGHFPSSDSVKSRFKALFKKWPSWIRRCCFSWIFAPGGRLNHEALQTKILKAYVEYMHRIHRSSACIRYIHRIHKLHTCIEYIIHTYTGSWLMIFQSK